MMGHNGGLSPEAQVLLCCGRAYPEPDRIRRLRELLDRSASAPLDWETVLRLGAWHGTLPLLYWNLNPNYSERVPVEILDRLREHFHATVSRNLFMTGELVRLLRLFREEKIPAVPLKGPALARSIYDNLALREYSDLDILVPRRDVSRVKKILADQNYKPQLRLSGKGEAAFLESNYELCFSREGASEIEIHWGFQEEKFLCSKVSPESWWDRLRPLPLGGEEALMPSHPDLLLFLCAHGAKHAWNRLKWIADVAELLRISPEIDWRELVDNVDAWGAERLILLGVHLAHSLLGAPIPDEIAERIRREPAIEPLAALVMDRLWNRMDSPPGIIENAAFHLRMRTRWRDKGVYCLRNAMVPTAGEWKLIPLPEYLSFLYYPIRPLRLMGTYGLDSLRRFFG